MILKHLGLGLSAEFRVPKLYYTIVPMPIIFRHPHLLDLTLLMGHNTMVAVILSTEGSERELVLC